MAKAKKKKSFLKKLKRIVVGLFIAHFLYIFICLIINPPITITQLVSLVQGHGLKRDMVSDKDLGLQIKLAVIASEDQLFPEHDGFDVKAIKKAREHNEKNPKKIRGASTISQQTAKNVFLWQGGGYFRKGLEVYFTFMIETFWSKKRILQTYLNVAEMGTGIFGAQAAAKYYFKKDAKNLTAREAALIAAILPNPKVLKIVPLSGYVNARAARIQRQMQNLKNEPEIKAVTE